MVDYFNWLQLLVNSIRASEEFVNDQSMVEKILRILSPKFDYIVVAIEESKDIKKILAEEL